jgi:hypothetical protein
MGKLVLGRGATLSVGREGSAVILQFDCVSRVIAEALYDSIIDQLSHGLIEIGVDVIERKNEREDA